jgi:hypothetical protein
MEIQLPYVKILTKIKNNHRGRQNFLPAIILSSTVFLHLTIKIKKKKKSQVKTQNQKSF